MNKNKAALLKKIHGGQVCQIVATCARLKIADLVKESPKSLKELSEDLKIPKDLLFRLLSALVALFLLEESEGKYSLTEEGRYLASDDEESLQAIAAYKGAPFVFRSLGHLHDGLLSGCSPFEIAHGTDQFTYLSTHPEELALYQDAMACYENQSSKKILEKCDFSKFQNLLDVGGGTGGFSMTLMRRHPHISFAVYDLPQVIEKAQKRNITFIAGNFFDQIPSGYDAYLLRNILHDWPDDKCRLILDNLRDALPSLGKVLIFETLFDPSHEKRLGKFADLTLFTLTPGGRERTLEQFETLLGQSRLSVEKVFRSTGSKALILCGVK